MLRTYQTKIKNCDTKYLDEVASFFGTIERKLFVDVFIRKKTKLKCKKDYLIKYNITARQFNSIYIVLEGKVKAIQETNKYQIKKLKRRIYSLGIFIQHKSDTKAKVHNQLLKLQKENKEKGKFLKIVQRYQRIKLVIHQKKRKLYRLKQTLEQLEKDCEENKLRICFGSRKLFKKQFHFKKNEYTDHKEWKEDWLSVRNNNIYCIGSKDESSGNQTCTYNVKHELRLRVANQFNKDYGKYIVFKDITFPYGQKNIDYAIKTYMGRTKRNNIVKYCNSAISYRFIKKEKGWYIFATVHVEVPKTNSLKGIGSIGVDLNAGFVSLCEIDRFGNPLKEKKIRMHTYSRRKNQVNASIGDSVKEIIDYCIKTRKPLAIEALNFKKKKANLKEESKKCARMLSAFAYSKFKERIKARAAEYGVEVIEVSAKYTSIMGQIKYMKRYGLSSHGSAACMIARRGMGYKKEKIKYINNLGDYRELIEQKKTIQERWVSLTYKIKKKYSYKKRIELLKESY